MIKKKENTHTQSIQRSKQKSQNQKSNHTTTKAKSAESKNSNMKYKSDDLNDNESNLSENGFDKEFVTGYDEELDDVYEREYKTSGKSRIGKSFVLNSSNLIQDNTKWKNNKITLTRNSAKKPNSRIGYTFKKQVKGK